MSAPELDDLADAITAVASARKRIALAVLLRETALNVLILTRIASNRIGDKLRREDIESAADHLVAQLRHAAWDLPPQIPIASPSPPEPRTPPPVPPMRETHATRETQAPPETRAAYETQIPQETRADRPIRASREVPDSGPHSPPLAGGDFTPG